MSTSRGVPYFFNTSDNTSRWDPPTELSEAEVQALPGAKEYLGVPGAAAGGGKPGEVRASHLLVKHNGSRRPSSWKEASLIALK